MKHPEEDKNLESMLERIAENVFCRIQDRSDRSASDTVSKLFKEVSNKLDSHIEVTEKRWQRIEPYISQAEDDREFRAGLESRGKKIGLWGGIWLTLAGVAASIYYGLKHIR